MHKTLAVAAHHRPLPAFQVKILIRASLGSILKGPWHLGGGQKMFSQGFQDCTIFVQQTSPRTEFFGGNFHPFFFVCYVYGLTQNLSGNKEMVKSWIRSTFMYPCMGTTTFLAGNWHKSSPQLTPWTPDPVVFKCFKSWFLLPWTIQNGKLVRFVCGTKFGRERWAWQSFAYGMCAKLNSDSNGFEPVVTLCHLLDSMIPFWLSLVPV